MPTRIALALAVLSTTACQADAGILFHRHQSRTMSKSVVRTHTLAPRRVAFLGVPLVKSAPAGGCVNGKCPAK